MNDDELAKLVNRSGFLFQLAVEDYVRQTCRVHEWEVLAHEYPWMSGDGSRSGFIDFIAGRNYLRCVIDCKRTQGGEWIFLVPEDARETIQLRTLWAYKGYTKSGFGWDDLEFLPASLRSEFCIVRGSSDDDKPMLERIAADLVRASESLAREELSMAERHQGAAGYLPVIITNAKLYACVVSPGTVDLASGTVPSSARFQEISAIRFRKALPSDLFHQAGTYNSFRRGLLKKERSAFVVQVAHIADWLQSLQQAPRSLLGPLRDPWWELEQ